MPSEYHQAVDQFEVDQFGNPLNVNQKTLNPAIVGTTYNDDNLNKINNLSRIQRTA